MPFARQFPLSWYAATIILILTGGLATFANYRQQQDALKHKVYRIVLTGGPCGGKSSSIRLLTKVLEERGHTVFSQPEIPTLMMKGGCTYPGLEGGDKLMAFESALIQMQLQIEKSFVQVGASLEDPKPPVIIMDRGMMDYSAYLPKDKWLQILRANDLTEDKCLSRYDGVIHLTTAADGAEGFYKNGLTKDDNGEVVYRNETYEEARVLDGMIKKAWANHPKHAVIDNLAEGGFDAKLNRAAEFVLQIVTEGDA